MFTHSLSLSLTHPQEKTTLPQPPLSLSLISHPLICGHKVFIQTPLSVCLLLTIETCMTPRPSFKQTKRPGLEKREGRELETVEWLPPLVRLRLAFHPLSQWQRQHWSSVCVRLRLTTYGQSSTLCQHCSHSIVAVKSSGIVTAVNCHCALGVLYKLLSHHMACMAFGISTPFFIFSFVYCFSFSLPPSLPLSPSLSLSLSLPPSLSFSFGSQLQVFKFFVPFTL